MLAPITDFKQKITLIAESGIQFLDFAICLNDSQPRNFVRQTANGPLLRVMPDAASGRFLLPQEHGAAPEVVKPECSTTLAQSRAAADPALRPAASVYRRPGKLGAPAGRGAG